MGKSDRRTTGKKVTPYPARCYHHDDVRRDKVEEQIAEFRRLRNGPLDEAALSTLHKGLTSKINLVCGKAAEIAGQLRATSLIPDLIAAFDRFFKDNGKCDPQCWAKNAIAKALTDLDFDDSATFLRGHRYVQMEASYGGHTDTAVTLRSLCTLALVQCTDISRSEKLRHLVTSLTDPVETVRIDAIRAIEQMEGDEAALLLRLKAGIGDREAPVVGQALESLLQIEGEDAIEFVREFLNGEEERSEEAALALGASRLPKAVEVLKEAWQQHPRVALLQAISSSRQESGFAFLLDIIANGRDRDSAAAAQALSLHRDTPELQARVEAALRSRGTIEQ